MSKKINSYAVGIENTSNRYRLLFLDIDRRDCLDELLERLLKEPHTGAILVLKTEHGFHAICMKPLPVLDWKNKLNKFADLLDKQFYRISLRHNRSVLRISAKFSAYNAKDIFSPAPSFLFFIEQEPYPLCGISMLYARLYNLQLQKAYIPPKFDSKVVMHFYATTG